ncbi:nitroreductase family protein [Cellulomonas bogoriensis]|uniref:Nitroreductase n=1 Tax=Cellulomonas bogoriensis 69B4 = DSM 16987 TaxID=1386082 RepID=A0A0A0BZV7_9CELL|nr:nitroreductase family protein [Cellulomonas bogoriensis]KGM13476.1 nitroreductase [Cellulomonas bogoriensis 69B4 = DSM 16987]
MELQDVVRRRRMVRRYTDDPVPPHVVDRALRNAVRAPNAGFSQGWAFLVLDAPGDVARFWEATTPTARAERPSRWLRGMRTAPVVIVPLASESTYRERYARPDKTRPGHPPPTWPVPYWYVDAGMAALLILQTAVDEGLGACFFGIPGERVQTFNEAFDVPADHAPVGAITLGHPAPDDAPGGSPTTRTRRPLDDVVHRGRWGTRA